MRRTVISTSITHVIASASRGNPLNDGIASSSRCGRPRNDAPLNFRNSVFALCAYLASVLLLSWYFRLSLDQLASWGVLTPLAIAVAVAAAYALVRHSATATPRWLVATSIALLWAVFLFTPKPVTIQLDDRSHYYLHAKMLVRYGLNPVAVPLSAIAQDADYPAVEKWHYFRFNYGPLWLVMTATVALFASSLAVGLVLLQALVCGALALGAFAASRLGEGHRDGWRIAADWLLHPLVLFWGVSGGHNDAVVAAGLLWALWMYHRGRTLTAAAIVAASALVKPVALVFWPVFMLAALRAKSTHSVYRRLVMGVATAAGLAVVSYLPVWPGWETLATSIHTGNPLLAGPLVMVLKPLVGPAAPSIAIIMFILAYAVVLRQFMRKPSSLERMASACVAAGVALLAASPLLQPWYALWLIPFFLVARQPWSRWLELGVIVYSLTFYSVFYPAGSLASLVVILVASLALVVMRRSLAAVNSA